MSVEESRPFLGSQYMRVTHKFPARRRTYALCFIASMSVLAIHPTPAQAAPPAGYSLVWSDEFNQALGSRPDPSVWKYDLGSGGFGNGELETYVDDSKHVHIVQDPNAVDGKALQILTTNSDGYKSVRMLSAGKKSVQYGFIEARIKLPYGQGIWPAFWMLNENIAQVSWPSGGEIDIMENIGKSSWYRQNLSSLHSGAFDAPQVNFTRNAPYLLPKGETFHDRYHLFQMLWLKDSISFYVDGNLYETRTAQEYGKNPWPFNAPFFFLINTAVGGPWAGSPDSSTRFPQQMLVDYVRVYQGRAPVPPPRVHGIVAHPGDAGQLQVSWNGNLNASDYIVTRNAGSGTKPVSTTVAGTRFVDSGLTPKHKYIYQVTAINAAGKSKSSRSVAVVIPVPAEKPFSGTPRTIPGRIQAEDYDTGGEGLGYHEDNAASNGGSYRPDDAVHIEETNDVGGGFDVGYAAAGKWLKYTVDVAHAGTYTVRFRVSAAGPGGTFHVDDARGRNLTGPVNVANTGGWQNWVDVSAQARLNAGVQTIKLFDDTGGFNVNWMSFELSK